MNNDRRQWLGIGAVGALALGAGYFWRKKSLLSEVNAGAVNTLFTQKFNDLQGGPFTISGLARKYVIVNFWATWCAPCREEIPEFIRLQSQFQAQSALLKDVSFVGLAIDRLPAVQKFAQEITFNYPVALLGAEWFALTQQLGNVQQSLPFSIIFDAAGKIVFSKLGKLSTDEILSIVSK